MILTNGNQCSNAGLSFGLVCGIFAALTYSILIIFAKQVKVVSGIEYTLIQLISCLITVGIYLTIKQGPYIPNLMQIYSLFYFRNCKYRHWMLSIFFSYKRTFCWKCCYLWLFRTTICIIIFSAFVE